MRRLTTSRNTWKILLDTHAFLWFAFGDSMLSQTARNFIEEPANEKFGSLASLWEMAIKIRIGKLLIQPDLNAFVAIHLFGNGFQLLPIELAHVAAVSTMPLHHRDPFDRLLAAQSLTEPMPILSGDSVLDGYGLTRFW